MIRTAGTWKGREDAEEWPLYFLATASGDIGKINALQDARGNVMHKYLLSAVNEIDDENIKLIEAAIDNGYSWLIDSGIFNLCNQHAIKHKMPMDAALAMSPEDIDGFKDLFSRYVATIKRIGDKVWGYIELDQGGRENKIKTRAKLEGMGFKPIPVYHPLNDGWDYFDYLAERYDRICFGNVVQADIPTRKRLVATAWQRKRKYPHLWIHLLGYTPNELLNAWPVDSADSSSWLAAVRWGGIQPRAMMKSFSEMDKNYMYVIKERDGERGYMKSRSMTIQGFHFDARNWRNHLNRLTSIGFDLLPDPGVES